MCRPGDDVRAYAARDRAALLGSIRASARKGLTFVDVPALHEHRAARDLDIERRDWVAVAREPFGAGERWLGGSELTEPRVRDRQEAHEDRGRERVGAPCENLERRLEPACALAHFAAEHHADGQERLRDGLRDRIAERGADVRRAIACALQFGTRLRILAARATEERDPEVHVTEERRIGPRLSGRDRALEPTDRGRGPGGSPASSRAAERGAQPELDSWIVWPEASVRSIEERERLAVREALERVLARDHQVLGSRRGVASAFEVERDHGRKLAPPLGVEREQRVGGKGVERPAVLLPKRAVGGVLDERVPEEVLQLRLERCHLHEAARLKRA